MEENKILESKEEKALETKTFIGLNDVTEDPESQENLKEKLYKNDSTW